jgi:hypothetical protein
MLNKVTGLAGALAVLLAIVAGFVEIPGLNASLAILALGMIGGITLSDDGMPKVGMATIALPVSAAAMASLPTLGTQLGGMLGGFAIAAAGSFAVGLTIRAVKRAIDSFKGLAG